MRRREDTFCQLSDFFLQKLYRLVGALRRLLGKTGGQPENLEQ